MRHVTTLVGLVVLMLTVATVPAIAHRDDRPVHIALGDSIAAGVGASNPTATGYVPRLHRWMKAVDCRAGKPSACPGLRLVDRAVPGATSATLITDQLLGAVAEIVNRNNDDDPGNDVTLVTITIGGNDVFDPVLGACAAGVDEACVGTIQAVFGSFTTNLVTILGTLQAVAPGTTIVIQTYSNPLIGCDLAPLAPLGDMVLEGGGGLLGGLNDIIRGVAAVTGSDVAETSGLLNADDLVGGTDCLHPDNSGYRKIARAFQRAATS